MNYNYILDKMNSDYTNLCGFPPNDASSSAIMLKVLASQIFSLHNMADFTLRQVSPNTAAGNYLDFHAQNRGLQRNPPSNSVGILRFSRETELPFDIPIPKGTSVWSNSKDNLQFITTKDAVLPAEQLSVDVEAVSADSGSINNISSHSVTTSFALPQYISAVTNPVPFYGATDAESDDELRKRILDDYADSSNLTNSAYYKQLALRFDEVKSVNIIPCSRGKGTVDIVVTGTDAEPIPTVILAEIQNQIDQEREICVSANVMNALQFFSSVSIALKVKPGYQFSDVSDEVALKIKNDGIQFPPGETVRISYLNSVISSVQGVLDHKITSHSNNIHIPATSVICFDPINFSILE